MISFCQLPEHRLSIVKLQGRVEFAEVLRYLHLRLADTTRPPPGGMDSLIDLRELENTHTYDEVSQLSDLLRQAVKSWGDKRVAMLVHRDAHYGVSRMFGMVMTARTEVNISIFRSIEDASEWLNHPLATLMAETPPDQWQTPLA